MTGDRLTYWLMANYILIACAYAWDGNWPKTAYWACALGITTAVVWMK